MKRSRIHLFTRLVFAMLLLAVGCSSEEEAAPVPVLKLTAGRADAYSLNFTVSALHVERAAWVCVRTGERIPSAADVLAAGRHLSISTVAEVQVDELEPNTSYTIVAAASNNGNYVTEELEMATTEAPADEKSHALIVFMQGDNGLEKFMDVNLQRVITAYYDLPETARVVVFYDRGNYTRLTELYLDDGMVKQRLIEEYNSALSSTDPAFVKQVFQRIEQEVEADSYGLILSSHGGGWVPSEIYDLYLYYDWEPLATTASFEAAPLFYGQDGYECMELPDLSEAIATFHYDYILFDACFMASVEGLYDLRHNADYIIASSAEVLGDGFPYQDIIPQLFRPDHGLRLSCEAFMRLYEGRSATISLVKTAKLDPLADAMRRVVAADDGSIDIEQIQGYESFPVHLYYDLEQHVEQMTDDEELRSSFRSALSDAVIFTDHTPTFFSTAWREATIDLPRSCGLTCHVEREEFPDTHAAYLQTAWARYVGAQ